MSFIRRIISNMYGIDKLGYFIIIVSIISNLIGSLFRIRYFMLFADVLFFFFLFRVISSNKSKRYMENQKFIKLSADFKTKFCQAKSRLKDTKNNYFTCPKCKTILSVPKGVGKVCIVCKKCNHQFIKKSK